MPVRSPNHGRSATTPQRIPAVGWRDILWRVVKRLGSDNITLVSAGLALYALLSVFPGLAAAVSVYGLFATPTDAIKHMQASTNGADSSRRP
jgi:membrane protein